MSFGGVEIAQPAIQIDLGSAGVPPAVFGVPPKTILKGERVPRGSTTLRCALVGETPADATVMVALPIYN